MRTCCKDCRHWDASDGDSEHGDCRVELPPYIMKLLQMIDPVSAIPVTMHLDTCDLFNLEKA